MGVDLSVIGLEDGRRDLLLDRLAEYADLTELDRRGDHEVVKCVFTIAKADPQLAFAEIRGLVTLSTPLLLPQSRQVVVIETASKLRMIRATLEALESPDEEAGPVRRFSLEFIKAEAVLKAVRPLVGIENENGNIGPEISLSASADGKQVFGISAAFPPKFGKVMAENVLALVEGTTIDGAQVRDLTSEIHDVVLDESHRAISSRWRGTHRHRQSGHQTRDSSCRTRRRSAILRRKTVRQILRPTEDAGNRQRHLTPHGSTWDSSS